MLQFTRSQSPASTILQLGSKCHGDLGLSTADCAVAFNRIVLAIQTSEEAHGRKLSEREAAQRIIPEDAYLAQALVERKAKAWKLYSSMIHEVVQSLRSHAHTSTARAALREVADCALGTLFMDGRMDTYRATAPLRAWTRQVVLNLYRAQLAAGNRTAPLCSHGPDDEACNCENGVPQDRHPNPGELADHHEWDEVLARAVPAALKSFDRDELRMLRLLPGKQMTQVALASELRISPFRMNRWYKDVRTRFLRAVTRHIHLDAHLTDLQADRLIAWLAESWLPGKRESLQVG